MIVWFVATAAVGNTNGYDGGVTGTDVNGGADAEADDDAGAAVDVEGAVEGAVFVGSVSVGGVVFAFFRIDRMSIMYLP